VSLRITFDSLPKETWWMIKVDDKPWMSSAEPEFDGLLPVGTCITFMILDAAGNGICCQHGEGKYTLRVNGDLVRNGGAFGSYEETPITCLKPTPPSPPPAVADKPPSPSPPGPSTALPPLPPPVERKMPWRAMHTGVPKYQGAAEEYDDFKKSCLDDCLSARDCVGVTEQEECWGNPALSGGPLGRCCLLMEAPRVSSKAMFPFFETTSETPQYLMTTGDDTVVIKYRGISAVAERRSLAQAEPSSPSATTPDTSVFGVPMFTGLIVGAAGWAFGMAASMSMRRRGA